VQCAEPLHTLGWPENKVITYSPNTKINTTASTYTGDMQTALLNWLCKTKNKVVVSLHDLLFILISRSLSNLKQKYTTAFRHKLIHNCTAQPTASRSIMAANMRQLSTTMSDYYITHSVHVHDRALWTAHRCNNLEFRISLMQNRRQKAFNKGALRFCRGLVNVKIDKNSTDSECFTFQFGGAWSFV